MISYRRDNAAGRGKRPLMIYRFLSTRVTREFIRSRYLQFKRDVYDLARIFFFLLGGTCWQALETEEFDQ